MMKRHLALFLSLCGGAYAQSLPRTLSLNFPDPNPASSVTYQAQSSTDAATWTNLTTTATILAVAAPGTVPAGPNQLNVQLLTGTQPFGTTFYRVIDIATPGMQFQGQSLPSNVVSNTFANVPTPTPSASPTPTATPSPTVSPTPTPKPTPGSPGTVAPVVHSIQ
jgi:hypothetical protein